MTRYKVRSVEARERDAIGIFYEIEREYLCATAEEAERLFREEIETNAPPVVIGLRLYDACVAAGVPVQNHESDLYIPVTETTSRLLKEYGQKASTFTNQVEGGLWYDVPFAFAPWWDKRAAKAE